MYYIFFGPPGSGKGTQIKLFSEKFQIPSISTGNLLRHEIDEGTGLGKKVEKIIDEGLLVDDLIVEKIIEKYIKKADKQKGVIFDGYPRSKAQQDFLLSLIDSIDSVISILVDVSDSEVLRRLSGRRVCDCGATYHIEYNPPKKAGICDQCGKDLIIRDDDKKEVIQERLKVYHKQSEPMINFWKKNNKLIEVNGEQKIETVFKDILDKLEKYKKINDKY